MTSFDYLAGSSSGYRSVGRFFSTCASDGLTALCFACTIILLATWVLEAERLHRALDREGIWSQAAERNRIEAAKIARRYDRANAIINEMRSIDDAIHSGAEESRRLIDLANALPPKTWLTTLSDNGGEYTLEGGTPGLLDLGRALGAMGRIPRIRSATLVEAAPFPQLLLPDALRYRIRLSGNPP